MHLIVSDVDGTLLMPGERKIGINTASAIDYVLDKGEKFAVASGRSFTELRKLFARWEDRIYFIASDGALVIYRGETLFSSPVNSFSSDEFTAHGKYTAYLKSNSLPLIRAHMKHYDSHVMRIESFSDIDAPIYKVTDFASSEKKELYRVYTSRTMDEYVELGVNKGSAAEKLSSHLGIKKEDVISFGDNTNDLELFSHSGLSFAVKNASPKVKKAATCVAESFYDEIKKLI